VGWLDRRQQGAVAYLIEETPSLVDACAAGSASPMKNAVRWSSTGIG
jgi:hypothetical protein